MNHPELYLTPDQQFDLATLASTQLGATYLETSLAEMIKTQLPHMNCADSLGFEGPDTFPECEKCFICVCKKLFKIPT